MVIPPLNLRLPYCPHPPHPRQAIFLGLDDTREALFGGAAGGGKSDALLMAALQYVETPGYAALILRRTYADLSLPDAIMARAKEWLGGIVPWTDKTKTFTFPSGATLTFGYLDTAKDKYRYQGSAYQFIGFDELTQFIETDYLYLFSRLRKPLGMTVPLRVRSASNPGGIGHGWVYQRLIVEGRSKGRVFVPSKLRDNPSLDYDSYVASLAELDSVTRRQLLDGDWTARHDGGMFRREWFTDSGRILDEIPEGVTVTWVRRWDLAATEQTAGNDPDWTAGAKVGRGSDGLIYLGDMRRTRSTPAGVEKLIRATAEIDGRIPIRMEEEPGSAGKGQSYHYGTKVLWGRDFKGVRSTGSKEVRAQPLAAAAENGRIRLIRGDWINDFLDEAEAFPQSGYHDDQVDAASAGLDDLSKQYVAGTSGAVDPPKRQGNAHRIDPAYQATRRRVMGS